MYETFAQMSGCITDKLSPLYSDNPSIDNAADVSCQCIKVHVIRVRKNFISRMMQLQIFGTKTPTSVVIRKQFHCTL